MPDSSILKENWAGKEISTSSDLLNITTKASSAKKYQQPHVYVKFKDRTNTKLECGHQYR